jgi:hypothetical protein
MSVGGDEPRDMMDCVGQWVYAVEMVWTCILAMWPRWPWVFMILCM